MGEFLARLITEADLGEAAHRRTGRRDCGRAVRRGGPPGTDRQCDRRYRRSLGPAELGERLLSWVLEPDLDKYREIDPQLFINTAVEPSRGWRCLTTIRADYLACYEGDRFVESMRYVRSYPEQLPALAELLPQIDGAGSRSSTAATIASSQSRTREFLDEQLPNSRLAIIDAGHFVWEEAPAEYASIILDSVSRPSS